MATPLLTPDTAQVEEIDEPWLVMLGNDPVNTMPYVSRALQKVFGYTEDKAASLMLEAHVKGRAAVWSGEREKAEGYAAQLHSYSLWATVTQDR